MSAACRRLFSVFALAAVVMLLLAPSASGHAALIGTDPEDGTELEALPEQVTFTFNENMRDPAFASVIVDGHPVSLPAGDPRIEGDQVVVDLAGVTTEGRDWTVSYRVVSADGHAVEGGTSFTIPSAAVNDEPMAADGENSSVWSSPWLWVAVVVAIVVVTLLLFAGRRGPARGDTA